jgi:hypothetical protein
MSKGAVIFLDFDGVVITTRSRWAGLTPEGFDPVATRWLSQLIQQASAQVVISSAWRRGETRVSMLELLVLNGMPEVPLHEDWATPLLGVERQHEIDAWLGRKNGIQRYFILDDGIGLNEKAPEFVLTDIDDGLSFIHMLRCCKVLGVDAIAWARTVGIRLSSKELQLLN